VYHTYHLTTRSISPLPSWCQLKQLPEPAQTAVRISLKLARAALETAQREVAGLSPEPDGDGAAPTGVAKNVPIPLREDELIALQAAA